MITSINFRTPICVSSSKWEKNENNTNKMTQLSFFHNMKTRMMSLPTHTDAHMHDIISRMSPQYNYLIMLIVKHKC